MDVDKAELGTLSGTDPARDNWITLVREEETEMSWCFWSDSHESNSNVHALRTYVLFTSGTKDHVQ